MRNYMDLTGRAALITGASSGIGAASALVFSDLGARVVVGYHNNASGAAAIVEQISKSGGEAKAIRADVRQPAEITRLAAEATAAFGPIDILVNNAGWLVERQTLMQ